MNQTSLLVSACLAGATALACGGSSPPSETAREGSAGAAGASGAGASTATGDQAQASAGKNGSAGNFSATGGATSTGSAGKNGSAGSAGQTGSGGSAGMSTGAGGEPAPSSGCDTLSTLKEGEQPLTSGGVERNYYLIPAKTKGPVPLIIGFHGYGGSGKSMPNLFGQEALSAGKAVFIYPDGVPQAWYQNATGWDYRSATTADTIFIKDLIDAASKEHCIDTTRVYAVGFSWGGYMSNHVGCALGDRIRATASFAGGPTDTKNCTGPASVLFAHGTADESEQIGEGRKARDEWLELNGCGSTTSSAAGGACVSYADCTSPVWWCEHSGTHEVPTALQPVVWDFLQNSP